MSEFKCIFSLTLLLTGVSGSITADEPRDKPRTQPQWEKLLAWLPTDTETIVVSQKPFDLPKWVPPNDRGPKEEQANFNEMIRLVSTGLVFGLKNGMLHEPLASKRITCCVEGSRNFRSPKNLGLMPYEGCHVIQFDASATDDLKKAFNSWLTKAEKKLKLGGETIAVFTEKMEDDTWTVFVSQPRDGVLLIATNQDYLEQVLKRIDQKSEQRAMPAELPEWKQVNLKAQAWGIRHYRKESAANDPSSPLRAQAAANRPDPDAVGFTFWYDGGNTAEARYLTNSKKAVALATPGWRIPAEGLKPKIKQGAAGVVEISVDVSEQRAGQMFVFVLLANLGHAIYL